MRVPRNISYYYHHQDITFIRLFCTVYLFQLDFPSRVHFTVVALNTIYLNSAISAVHSWEEACSSDSKTRLILIGLTVITWQCYKATIPDIISLVISVDVPGDFRTRQVCALWWMLWMLRPLLLVPCLQQLECWYNLLLESADVFSFRLVA